MNSSQSKVPSKVLWYWITILSSNSESSSRLCLWQNTLGNFFSFIAIYLTHIATPIRKRAHHEVERALNEKSELGFKFPAFPITSCVTGSKLLGFSELWFIFVHTVLLDHSQSLHLHIVHSCFSISERRYGLASRNLTLNQGHQFTIWSLPEKKLPIPALKGSIQTRQGLYRQQGFLTGLFFSHPESSFT